MRRALLSVTDKSGIKELAGALIERRFELVSTGGTATALRDAGFTVADVSEVTGFPEMLDGRVKTLHPMVHGGLLGDVRNPVHQQTMLDQGIGPFQVVCVNLYAFEQTVAREHRLEEAIESIDIGGPAMIRSAAKNNANVLVVVDPKDYDRALVAIDSNDEQARLGFAAKAFRHTAFYDSMISRYLSERFEPHAVPENLTIGMRHDGAVLRYGENPHQTGTRFIDPLLSSQALVRDEASSGKEISYNNWLDADAAWELVCDLPIGACAIIKHGNPCGVAIGKDLGESYRLARASDPVSAFGGIVAFNGKLDRSAVEAMTEKGNFLEVVLSEGWRSPELADLFLEGSPWTKNVRFLVGKAEPDALGFSIRAIRGGYLVQDRDRDPGEDGWTVATTRSPSPEEWESIRLGWSIVLHVKSNAIVVTKPNRMIGVGAGQMNRVQSVRLALEQAGVESSGAALASDAFFPFPDSIEAAAKAGVSAIVQPGGSKKDGEVIKAADELGIAMVLTGVRHFRH